MSKGDDNSKSADEVVGKYRGSGSRYDNAACPTGICPYIKVTELPYERQIDEPDSAYHKRLRERFQIAQAHANLDEIAAIRAALQMDIGIPEDGLHVPCRDDKEWLVWAYIQGVKPDAWLEAERLTSESEEESWFAPGFGAPGYTLWKELNSLFDPAGSWIGSLRFIGPDGFLYNLLGGHHSQQTRSLVGLLRDTSKELGVSPLASLEDVQPDLRPTRYGFQTTEPPSRPLSSFLFEYETLTPAGKTDFGENVRLAQGGPVTSDAIRGPFGVPSGQPQRNIGATPRGYGAVIVHNGRGGPFSALYRDGLSKTLQSEGLSMKQFNGLRQSNPSKYQEVRRRAQQSARLRIPGVRADMKAATSRGESIVTRQGGKPNFHDYRADMESGSLYVRPDGFKGARYDTTGRAKTAAEVIEVKHVTYQAYTQQIQGQVRLARDMEAKFHLIIQQRTVLSSTLKSLEANGNIIVTRMP